MMLEESSCCLSSKRCMHSYSKASYNYVILALLYSTNLQLRKFDLIRSFISMLKGKILLMQALFTALLPKWDFNRSDCSSSAFSLIA